MSTAQPKTTVSKQQWLTTAMDLFSRVGERGLTIHALAREVGVAKAGFYWHFKDRAELLDHMLDYWVQEFTETITANPELLEFPASERLLMIMQLVDERDLTRYDVHFRAWAQNDRAVAERLGQVIEMRLATVRDILSEIGFKGDDLEMRAQLFVCYGSNEGHMFGGLCGRSRGERERAWRLLHAMATARL